MAAKGRILIRLVSTGKTQAGKPTGTFYTKTKNKNPISGKKEKLEFKKYDRRAFNAVTGKVGAHVPFKEDKIK